MNYFKELITNIKIVYWWHFVIKQNAYHPSLDIEEGDSEKIIIQKMRRRKIAHSIEILGIEWLKTVHISSKKEAGF